MERSIPVAVIGVGYLGRFHAQKYAALPDCRLVAVVDSDLKRAQLVGKELGVPAHADPQEIFDQVEAVTVAASTQQHYAVAQACLHAGKHCLVEKPLAATVDQAQELVTLAARKNLLLQVGYLERLNPAFAACRPRIRQPHFIETLRIGPFSERGADVDVVLDLMSHDLDLVLSLVHSPIKHLHAVGLSLATRSTDLASVRLTFADGCVANLTASRISNKPERKFRLIQDDSYFSMDLSLPGVKIYSRPTDGGAHPPGKLVEEILPVQKGDALLLEVESFLQAVRNRQRPLVTGDEGLQAMLLAELVISDIERNRIP
jgi:predicted dehydrogenase